MLHTAKKEGGRRRRRMKNMGEIDKRNRFDAQIFTYRATRDGKVFLFWYGRQVMILKGARAQAFLDDVVGVDDREVQLIIARLTGNFRRGNERR